MSSITFSFTPSFILNNSQLYTISCTLNNGNLFVVGNAYVLNIGTFYSGYKGTNIATSTLNFQISVNSSIFGTYPLQIYVNGNITLFAVGSNNINVTCFVKGTKIECENRLINVENIKENDKVLTYCHGYKKVKHILKMNYKNEKNSLSQICQCGDLKITGAHAILVDELTETEKEKTFQIWNHLPMIDDKYLLIAYLSDKFEKLDNNDEYELYHLVLENNDPNGRYGIYSDDILTETMSFNCYKYMDDKSKILIVDCKTENIENVPTTEIDVSC
jgi:hypothetical protein